MKEKKRREMKKKLAGMKLASIERINDAHNITIVEYEQVNHYKVAFSSSSSSSSSFSFSPPIRGMEDKAANSPPSF